MYERGKTFHALDRATTVIGNLIIRLIKIELMFMIMKTLPDAYSN
jgi:hypothetical protein